MKSFPTRSRPVGGATCCQARGQSVIREGGIIGAVQISLDISDRKRAEEQRKLLVNELNHRVKNTLAVVQSIASQTIRNSTSLAEAKRTLSSRLVSLAKAHDVLTHENWRGADLEELIAASIRPHAPMERFQLSGDEVWVEPNIALSFALAFHELTTNAIKYGALSNATGTVSISWGLIEQGPDRRLELEWRESGGPVVAAVKRKGFGMQLLEGMFSRVSRVSLSFDEAGLLAAFSVSLSASTGLSTSAARAAG